MYRRILLTLLMTSTLAGCYADSGYYQEEVYTQPVYAQPVYTQPVYGGGYGSTYIYDGGYRSYRRDVYVAPRYYAPPPRYYNGYGGRPGYGGPRPGYGGPG